MCFTGGYAMATATEDRLLAPVLSEPSNRFPVTPSRRRTIDISRADLDVVKNRCHPGAGVAIDGRSAGAR